jgi:cytochrome c biogenesis protein CcmG, thiol:disulfide interchange protein DsbE
VKKYLPFLPLIFFAALVGLFTRELQQPDRDILVSPLINKTTPQIALPMLRQGTPLSSRDFQTGQPVLVNFFASWCPPCHAEHAQLVALAKKGVLIYGIAVKDKPADTEDFLKNRGNPFARIYADARGRGSIEWGVSAYPESYIVDGKGIIRYKHVSAILPEHVPQIMAELAAAK